MKSITIIVNGITLFFLWYTQIMPPWETGKAVSSVVDILWRMIWQNRAEFAAVLCVLAAVFQLYSVLIEPEKRRLRVIRAVLEDIMLNVFNNEKANYRITLYEVRHYVSAIFIFYWHWLKRTDKKANFRSRPRWWQPQLVITARLGQPFESSRLSMFPVATHSDGIVGIVSYVYYSEEQYYRKFLTLPKDVTNLTKRQLSAIVKYKEEGYLTNEAKFKSISRHSTEFWATPILQDGKKTGVCIVDVNANLREKMKETQKRLLDRECRLLSSIP